MNFLEIVNNLNFIKQSSVLVFTSKNFPILFFYLLKQRLKAEKVIEVKSINLEEINFNDLISELSFSFLGNRSFFWLGNIDNLSAKIKQDLLLFVQNYKGPNILSFFSSEDCGVESKVEIPAIDDFTTKQIIFNFCINNKKAIDTKAFFEKFDNVLNVDQVILLSNYANVVGLRSNEFFKNWSSKIVQSESSIFTLTTYFFSKNLKQFLNYWLKIKDNFPDTFWTVFWMDQAFRAYWFIFYKQQKDYKNMKKVSFKLPFSFINGDFQKSSLSVLLQLQDDLYMADCNLKQGFGSYDIELSLINYLNS